jgi:hypothetical protein
MNAKAQQAIARMETYAKFPFLIQIIHATLGTFRFANSEEDIIYNGEVYKAAYFSIDPPDKDGSKVGDGLLTMSAVDQLWIERIRSTQIAAKIKFIAAIVYEDSVIAGVEQILDEMDFTLRSVNWDKITITWVMTFDERMRNIVPCDKATALKCPGVA